MAENRKRHLAARTLLHTFVLLIPMLSSTAFYKGNIPFVLALLLTLSFVHALLKPVWSICMLPATFLLMEWTTSTSLFFGRMP